MKRIELRPTLFWDIDPKQLDANNSMRLIVERVLTRGNLSEFKQLIGFYSNEELRNCVVKIGQLDARTLNFITGYMNIPKEDFLCYKKKQSNPAHCNY